MIDAVRNLDTTYRISRHSSEGVTLKTYPPSPSPVTDAWYRMDQLPQWMLTAIALLDAASPAGVEGLGHRVGEITYWIEPPPRDTAGDRIAALVSPLDINRITASIVKKVDEISQMCPQLWEPDPDEKTT